MQISQVVKKFLNRNSNFAIAQFAKLFVECPALGLGHVSIYPINVTIAYIFYAIFSLNSLKMKEKTA